MTRKRKTSIERFEAGIRKDAQCWIWIAYRLPSGYGYFWDGKRREYAHRVSWRTFRGEIPEGLHVLHRCDIPACVNPDHLFLGTAKDNRQDAIRKGRVPMNERHPHAKLSQKSAREIRNARSNGETYKEIARRYGVNKNTVRALCLGRTWKEAV